jgi:hypothetical protein
MTPEPPDGLDAAFDELDRALPPHWWLAQSPQVVETSEGQKWRAIAQGRHGARHAEDGATRADAVLALARWLKREFPGTTRP